MSQPPKSTTAAAEGDGYKYHQQKSMPNKISYRVLIFVVFGFTSFPWLENEDAKSFSPLFLNMLHTHTHALRQIYFANLDISWFDKYMLWFGWIHFSIWTNTFYDLDKYILLFDKYIFLIWTNKFYDLDKCILWFEQKHFMTWTNTF